jgi:hypothetical protein
MKYVFLVMSALYVILTLVLRVLVLIIILHVNIVICVLVTMGTSLTVSGTVNLNLYC